MKKTSIMVLFILVIAGYYYLHNKSNHEGTIVSSANHAKKNNDVNDSSTKKIVVFDNISPVYVQKEKVKKITIKKTKNVVENVLLSANMDNEIKSFLEEIKNDGTENIGNVKFMEIASILKNEGKDHSLVYQSIINLYKSNIPESSKIMLANLLGEISTAESALTLMKILDFSDSKNAYLVNHTKNAINNLIYDNTEGKPNKNVSTPLLEYWEKTNNPTYKNDISRAILKIGNFKESKIVIQKFNSIEDENEIRAIGSILKEVRDEKVTSFIIKNYYNENTNEDVKQAYIQALPHIANKTAILALYEWSASEDATLEDVEKYFQIVKSRNPNAEFIVKEELYSNGIQFTSNDIKVEIERIFKEE